jgi:hypothetical protein
MYGVFIPGLVSVTVQSLRGLKPTFVHSLKNTYVECVVGASGKRCRTSAQDPAGTIVPFNETMVVEWASASLPSPQGGTSDGTVTVVHKNDTSMSAVRGLVPCMSCHSPMTREGKSCECAVFLCVSVHL